MFESQPEATVDRLRRANATGLQKRVPARRAFPAANNQSRIKHDG